MRRSLLDILACPVCKGDLILEVEEEDGEDAPPRRERKSGKFLRCRK